MASKTRKRRAVHDTHEDPVRPGENVTTNSSAAPMNANTACSCKEVQAY
jgi:hypothetical protein